MRRVVETAALGSLLTRADRFEPRDDLTEYQFAGTYSFGRGIFVGERKNGASFRLDEIQRVQAGDFVYCKIMAWEGAFGLVPKEADGCVMSGAFVAYTVNKERVIPRYLDLYFRLPQVWKAVGGQSTGTNVRRRSLHPSQFEATSIPLPPLDEQRRIVARIEELAGKIEEARGLRQETLGQAELLEVAVMKQMRNKMLQSSYPRDRLGCVTHVTSGGTPSRDNPSYWNGSIPWIKTGELRDGDISDAEEYITDVGLANSSAKLFPIDTILIAIYGQGQTRGRTARLLVEATTNQACCAVLPELSRLEPRFLQYWLRSLYLELREESHGGAQPNWNGKMINNITIALPPLSVQRASVIQLDELVTKVQRVKYYQAEAAAELDALLPSILDKAFKGEL
jgi:type I restriction enzyme S subunit